MEQIGLVLSPQCLYALPRPGFLPTSPPPPPPPDCKSNQSNQSNHHCCLHLQAGDDRVEVKGASWDEERHPCALSLFVSPARGAERREEVSSQWAVIDMLKRAAVTADEIRGL